MVSGVLFQGWHVGTLGNTLSGCVTQDPVPQEASAIHHTHTNVCVDVDTLGRLTLMNPIIGLETLIGQLAQSDQNRAINSINSHEIDLLVDDVGVPIGVNESH